MARPVVRWATGVVGCRMGVAYTPTPLEMMRFARGTQLGVLLLVALV